MTGTSTALSVLGADTAGESTINYTWSATGPGTVSFSANGTNAAKNTTATFTAAGNYTLKAVLIDSSGASANSSVAVTVNQSLTGVTVTPATATVVTNGTQQFTATAADQFGNTIASATFTWAVNGGGTISSSGLFTAGSATGGPFAVTASSGGQTGTASVMISATPPPPTGVSIWLATAAPGTAWINSTAATLGVKFRSDVAGVINGIRFYKGAGNTGTHEGLLYSSTGTQLGQATFTGETASGWQQVTLSPAISIAANTVYIAALFSTSGFAFNSGYFTSAGVDNVPLHALQSSGSGGNGVYVYGSTPQYPNATYGDANYWVDVVFAAANSSTVTIATPASASPSPVTGTSTALSVLGADTAGESSINYTWSATGPGTVSFSANGTNAAKNTTATFTAAGNYTLKAVLIDSSGASANSSVAVTVNQSLTGVTVTPATATVVTNGTQQFTATAADQFGNAIGSAAFTWAVNGGGTISSSGLFTAGSATGGPFTVTASSGGQTGTASVMGYRLRRRLQRGGGIDMAGYGCAGNRVDQ